MWWAAALFPPRPLSKIKPMTSSAPSAVPPPPPAAERRRLPRGVLAAALVLLALHFALGVAAKREASVTADELVHLTGGLAYWQLHDYRLHPENGILPQRWAALPMWLGGAPFPALEDNFAWRMSSAWRVGYQLFYETGQDHFPPLLAGRAMIALFSVATGALVFWIAWRGFGAAGALTALVFFCFSPDFLAHGSLVTSDVCVAFFLLAATWLWWRHLHDPRWRVAALSAVMLGLALAAKFSAVLLVPVMVLLAAVRAAAPEPWVFGPWRFETGRRKFAAAAVSAAGQAVVAAAVLWAFYGFRFGIANPELPPVEQLNKPWAEFVGQTGLLGEFARALAGLRVLPEGYLYGFDYVLATVKERSAFLNGDYSMTGWRTFFGWTFLLKTPLPALLAFGLAAVLLVRRAAAAGPGWKRAAYAAAPLLALVAVYGASSITSKLNIGHRHILPLYPVFFIAAGALGAWLTAGRRWRAAVVAGLLVWHAGESVRIFPYHLSYFNALAGGPANGWRHLVDSSLDWGQDLPALKKWLDANAGRDPVYLAYFGTGNPGYYGIEATGIGGVTGMRLGPPYVALGPGLYCVGATVLQNVYGETPGAYTAEREKLFQELRQLEPQFAHFTADPAARAELGRAASEAQWENAMRRFQALRQARLSAYLRVRGPDAHAGYSILIYRIGAEELRRATAGSAAEWSDLLAETVAKRR
jgi:hypothetical protein